MKNTMKIKSLLSFFVPAALMALVVASCSDYDNGYSEQAIKFAQDFRKTFGDIDPEQDWNLAERGTVTVSTMKESEVKIYALTGDEYTIVGDYQGVKGTQMLGFDMVEGTKSILVTDGVTAEKTVPGGVVTFGNTRFTVHEDSKEGVTVSRFTNETEINGKKYLAQKTPTEAEIRTVLEKVPEYTPNLNNVTSNFHYVSTGSFVLYPYYWNTSSINTLGVYYTDANNKYHEVDIYTLNGEESGYVEDYNVYDTDNNVVTSWSANGTDTDKVRRRPNDWFIEGGNDSNYNTLKKNGWTGDDPVLQKPFIEYWVSAGTGIGTKTIINNVDRTFTAGKKYLVEVKARLINQGDAVTNDNKGTITFSANDNKVILTDDASSTIKNGVLYSDMDGLEKIWVVCTADSEGKITLKFELNNVQCNWFAFNGMKIYDVSEMTKTGDNFYTSPERGKGIRVDIPVGTTFGMYLKKTDTGENGNTHSYTFYSESEKNDYKKVGSGVTVAVNADGNGKTKVQQPGTNPCYASTFKMPVTQNGDDEMFLGFEDWPNIYNNSDFDLNDVVFAFDGCKPTIINEEPDKWLLACEDLGGSFDIDYNDVVFSVEHISGQPTAKLTPLAAGGTLASYIYFQDPLGSRDKCFGEIHQLFGAERVNSGQYDIINARHRFEKTAPTIEFEVDESWTMAYYATGDGSGSAYTRNGKDVNMGGFEIRTLTSGNDAPFTLDINSSAFSGASKIQASVRDEGENVPYILCLPYSYKHYNYDRTTPAPGKKTLCVWAWPTELTAICNDAGTAGPYPDFAGWVQNHNNNTDWYKNKDYQYADAATVDNLFLSVSDMTNGENTNQSSSGGGNGESNNKPEPTLGTGIQIIQNSSYGTYSSATGDRVINMVAGDGLAIQTFGENIGNSGFSVKSFDAGGTGATYTGSPSSQMVISTGSEVGGTITVVFHFSGNDQYNAGDLTLTINVTRKVILKSSGAGRVWGMALKEGQLLTVEYNPSDSKQQWYVEPPFDGSGRPQTGVGFNLRNADTGQYLSFNDSRELDMQDTKPLGSQNARLTRDGDGRIYTARKNHNGYYIGLTDSNLETNWGKWPTGLVGEDGNVCEFTLETVN